MCVYCTLSLFSIGSEEISSTSTVAWLSGFFFCSIQGSVIITVVYLNTPIVIAQLFEGARIINNVIAGNATISAEDLKELKETFHLFCFDIMGLKEEKGSSDSRENAYGKVVDMLLEQRMKAKANKDWATSDEIRNTLTALGFEIKDTKDGFEWRLNK